MFFDVILEIEAPVTKLLEPYPELERMLGEACVVFELKQLPKARQAEHGCWEDDEVRGWLFHDMLNRDELDTLVRLFELQCRKDETESLEFSPERGMYYAPRLKFDGITRYTERFSLEEQMVVDCFVTPYPAFEPKNRMQEDLPEGVLPWLKWQKHSWERIVKAMYKVYG